MKNAGSSNDAIKQAASKAVQHGNIREQVRDLTLHALRERKLQTRQIREVVRAMSEGISLGAANRTDDVRHALSQAFYGLDEALMKSAEATHLALQELASESKEIAGNEIKRALNDLKRLEEDFLSTVSDVAGSVGGKVKTHLDELVTHARRSGTDTGAKVAATLGEFSSTIGSVMLDSTKAHLHVTREVSGRFAELARGILAGMADALRGQTGATRKRRDAPPAKK